MRCQLSLLQHKRITRSQRRGDFPRHLQQRVIPGSNQGTHAYRLVINAGTHGGVTYAHHAARILLDKGTKIVEGVGNIVHVVLRLYESLPGIG